MVKQKACKNCRLIHNDSKCPKCGSTAVTDTVKGKIEIVNPEKSIVAKNLNLKEKGVYAIKAE